MKTFLIIFFNLLVITVQSQIQISGTALTTRGTPVIGANIFIQGSYEGATTDDKGQFNFLTDHTGQQVLIASFIGFETQAVELDITGNIQDIFIVFKEQSSELEEVVKNVTTKAGIDYNFYDYSQNIRMDGDFLFSFINHQYSAFAESEVKITKSLALRAGIRAEYNSLLTEATINPRLSAAVKTGKSSQISAAYGTFSQNPEDEYLRFTSNLNTEKSEHSILTWQYKKGTQTMRLEAYNKKYSTLSVKYTSGNSPYS